MTGARPDRRWEFGLLLCFTFSGLSGLIYEVSWVRLLELVFGSTTYAVSTVLAVFMGGLALGSVLMGRLSHRFSRHHPLMLYAAIELGIGILAVLVPYLIRGAVPVEQWLWKHVGNSFAITTTARFVISTVVLLPPTILMGATLPLLSSLVQRQGRKSRHLVGWLYSANTLGAVAGCAIAGLILFPRLGLSATQWVAVTLNGLAALGAWRIFKSAESSGDPFESEPEVRPGTRLIRGGDREPTEEETRTLIFIYAVSGLVAMFYEVAWTRVLVMVLGSSTYAYSMMLTTFLMGLALGSWVGNAWLKNRTYLFHAAALTQCWIMITTYAGVQLVDELPFLYLKAYEAIPGSSGALVGMQFLFSFILMILPTLGLGAMFPITMQSLPSQSSSTLGDVGRAYALNTIGAILGSVLAGFWLVPTFGTQKTLLLGVMLNAWLAAYSMRVVTGGYLQRIRKPMVALLMVTGCAAFFLSTPWDPALMSSGIFRYANDYVGMDRVTFQQRVHQRTGDLLYYNEGLTCTVAVQKTRDMIRLAVNGKPDASVPNDLEEGGAFPVEANQGDLGTQVMLAQLPLLFADRRDEVLVIGLGSGVTLGSVLTHPVRRVDCLELEDSVVQGSRFFEKHNHQPLADPRTRLIVNDARNHLLVSDQRYDVIISEPSNPWIPGAANLFTQEFFELGKGRLREDGVFCLWLQMYEIQPEHFEMVLRTFASVFPDVHVFRQGWDTIVLGGPKVVNIDPARLQNRWSESIRKQFNRFGTKSPEEVLARYWVGGQELVRQIAVGEINTDDSRRIEFSAPLQVLVKERDRSGEAQVLRWFDDRSSGLIQQIRDPGLANDPAFWLRIGESSRRAGYAADALRYSRRSSELKKSPESVRGLALALELYGRRGQAMEILERGAAEFEGTPPILQTQAELFAAANRWPEVRRAADRWNKESPGNPRAAYWMGVSAFQERAFPEALTWLEPLRASLWDDRDYPGLPWFLGSLYWEQGRMKESVQALETYLRREPQHVQSRLKLIDLFQRLGRDSDAIAQCQKLAQETALAGDRVLKSALQSLDKRQWSAALDQLQQARRLKPWDPDIALRLAYVLEQRGDVAAASSLLENYLALSPDRPMVVGYLSTLLEKQRQPERAKLFAARYRVLTGEPWDPK